MNEEGILITIINVVFGYATHRQGSSILVEECNFHIKIKVFSI